MDSKKSYSEKLKDPRWQKMRLQILERDGWKCRRCGDAKSTLHVHHKVYLPGKDPWEYEPCYLATLCETCHQREYEKRQQAEDDLIFWLKFLGAWSDDVNRLALCIVSLSPAPDADPSLTQGDFSNWLRAVLWALEDDSMKTEILRGYLKFLEGKGLPRDP